MKRFRCFRNVFPSTVWSVINGLQEMSISELKVRLQGVVDRLSQLVERVTEKTELGVFLIAICRVREL